MKVLIIALTIAILASCASPTYYLTDDGYMTADDLRASGRPVPGETGTLIITIQ